MKALYSAVLWAAFGARLLGAQSPPSVPPPNHVEVIVYPQDDTSEFNNDYYLNEQMPFISELWTPFGMRGYHVIQLSPSANYSILTEIFFDNAQQFHDAFDAHGDEILRRVQYFSNRDPIRWEGSVINVAGERV
ncbi:hypothetical protein PT974_07609 [Cladobotryum mycophilum]|uniref:Uncharacterized protein n=1 Tax=Cladobotryum mycophilum TaxID=491253 RepID=A0ABR0SPQ3_9HYPO